MELKFTLPVFEGPLDLLLHLIDKNKVDIYDIPIVLITDQYFEYLEAMDSEDLDIMSEFLVMAATLLDIKARMLLPAEETEEEDGDPRMELVNRLLEHKKFKVIGEELKDLGIESIGRLFSEERLPEEVAKYKPPVDFDRLLSDLDIQKLESILIEVAARSHERINESVRNFGRLQRETIPIEAKISHVRKSVKTGKKKSFRALLSEGADKSEIIVTFLAVLELLKTGEIKLSKGSTTDDFILEGNDEQQEVDN